MKQLEWELKNLLNYNRDGGSLTQEARADTFSVILNEAKELGMPRITINSLLKAKTITKYVDSWIAKGKSSGTIKNRLSHIRWAAKHKGLSARVPTNSKLGIAERKYVTNESKATTLEKTHLDAVNNQNIKDSLRVQEAFGLRREEAIKFNPVYADQGKTIRLKGSWCKGGRPREIPVLTEFQRKLINELKYRYGNNSLIPANKTYKQQKDVYKNTVSKIGLDKKGHGLRHQYAQDRYKELSGQDCPAKGGLRQREMTKEERKVDKEIRLKISGELGHGRVQITSNYLGS